MGYYDFPHTRNYDTDLGYLIKRYFELNVDFESLEKNFNDLKAWCIAQLNSEALKTLVANKLDEWLQDGTLASLINNALLHVTSYDTVVEMITHTGLEIGSKIYCTGADAVNDGKGGHFRIRARLSTDNIDNYNLYLIDGGIKVAERIDSVNKNIKKYIFLGDSYNFSGGGWLNLVVSGLGISTDDYYDLTVSGHGFVSDGAQANKWITDITNWVNTKNQDILESITDVVIVGGLNDSSTEALKTLAEEITTFINYVKSNIPNAIVKVAYVGSALEDSSVLFDRGRYNRATAIHIYQEKISLAGGVFLNGCENAMCQHTFFSDDGLHPNNYGTSSIAYAVINALKTGYGSVNVVYKLPSTIFGSLNFINATNQIVNDSSILTIDILYGADYPAMSGGNYSIIGKCKEVSQWQLNPIQCVGTIGDTPHNFTLRLNNGNLEIACTELSGNSYVTIPTGQGWLRITNIIFNTPTILTM